MNVSLDQLRARFVLEGEIKEGRVPEVVAVGTDRKQIKCPACNSTVDYIPAVETECIECGLIFPVIEIKSDAKYDCPTCGVITDDDVVASTNIDANVCINCGETVESYVEIKRVPKRKKQQKPKQSLGDAIKKDKRSKFTMIDDDHDAMLHFGQFRENKLSDMCKSKRGRGYMRWMLDEMFPDYLKDAILNPDPLLPKHRNNDIRNPYASSFLTLMTW